MASQAAHAERPSKRARLLSDDSGSEDDASIPSNGHAVHPGDHDPGFKINSEYAKRFEHNKKREELHRLEDKYGKDPKQSRNSLQDGSDSDSSEESEDDEGELATRELDDEITATLQAIRSKDRRLYDKDMEFYRSLDTADGPGKDRKKEKPVYLQDYHRKNLLSGDADGDGQQPARLSYDQEQRALKDNLIDEMHRGEGSADEEDSQDDADGFFKAKPGQKEPATRAAPVLNVSHADRDPETYLSNFMASRAWVPEGSSQWQPFESDDEDEIDRADKFEEAYNLRFEDPNRANETLTTISRETAAKHSVRREKTNPRKRAREMEKTQKDEEHRQRDEEKARLRNLKLEKASQKLKQFKDASGLRSKAMAVDEWQKFLDAGWDSDKWDEEMERRFGEQYYADGDEVASDGGDDQHGATKAKAKVKKPKWDDEIDVGDILPDFDNGDDAAFSLSEGEERSVETNGVEEKAQKRNELKTKADKKREARKERRKLEALVDRELATDTLPASSSSKAGTGAFRYRETSPTSFGLGARDILMADDSSLNQFAGLKKLAAFRDAERKKKDKRKLGKNARLRQWRKETFGDEKGPQASFQEYLGTQTPNGASAAGPAGQEDGPTLDANIVTDRDRKKKKKRSRKRKAAEGVAD